MTGAKLAGAGGADIDKRVIGWVNFYYGRAAKMFCEVELEAGFLQVPYTDRINSMRCFESKVSNARVQSASPNMPSSMTREFSMGQSQSSLDSYLYLYTPQANKYRRINQVFERLTLFYPSIQTLAP